MRLLRLLGIAAAASLVAPSGALAHGNRVPVSQLDSAWRAPVVPLVAAALAIALFGQAFVRLRRRGRADHAGLDRAALFVLGVAVAVLAVASPLDAIGEDYLLSAHMLQHVLIADLAPALLLVAVRGPLVFFLLPGSVLSRLAHLRPLRSVLAWLLRPRVSFAIWAAVFAAWHVPRAYDYTLTHRLVHDLEHASFFVAGLLAWTLLVDPARRPQARISHRLAFAAALFAAGQALSYVLILSFSTLYPAYAAQGHRLLGLSPLTDQRLAGLVMMGEQLLTLGTCGILLVRAYGRERERRTRRTRPVAEARS